MYHEDVSFMIAFLHQRSGLVLAEDQQCLLENRLIPIARQHACADLAALVALLRSGQSEALMAEVTEAMTINESSFFRDKKPFEHLRDIVLPELRRNAGSRRTLRIWSAACAGGQEPYSVAMILQEDAAKYPGWSYEILATDLAEKQLEKASAGVYSQFEVQRGLPIQMLLKYFTSNADTSWQAQESLRDMVRFEPYNLLDAALPEGYFDLILCRNVLMYFDEKTKTAVMDHLSSALQPGGILCIGSTECLRGHECLAQLQGLCGIYQLTDASAYRQAKRKTAY